MEIGMDLTLLSRFRGKDETFARRFLSPAELALWRETAAGPARERFLAVRWACKEAIFKATGDPRYTGFSVLHDERGKPYVEGRPDLKVTVTHDGDYVAVTVLYEGEPGSAER